MIMLQFPEIELKEIKQFGEGFDNTVIQINGQFVFRFPCRPIAVTLIQVENQLCLPLQALFRLLSLNQSFWETKHFVSLSFYRL
ncbi:hypothetical protein KEH51_07390 [[Brevibacterium] frigoritolerans]|uniref:Uncharacterized protein n=1 Tax=Peribacillus frigoritolerans TaxID=450367 RepID=A0A941FGS7_9BACI|nr:hypothetical protein [Peribacillus frigoritolerans]